LQAAEVVAARFEILTDLDQIADLRAAWDELHQCSGGGPFSSMDWITSWHAAFGEGARPRFGLAWRDGLLTAALPLGLLRAPLWKRGPRLDKLSMLCSNRAGFHDVLAAPGHEQDAVDLMAEILAGPVWDLVDLTPMRAQDALSCIQTGAAERKLRSRARVEIKAAICRHDDGWQACLSRRSRGFRKSLRAGHRALENTEYQLLNATSPGFSSEQILAGALALSARSWKAQMGTDIGTGSRTRRFFHALWQQMSARQAMALQLLVVDGREAASYISLDAGGVSYGLIIDFDESYRKISPGRVVLCAAIEAAASRGLKATNMLRSTPFIDRLADEFESFQRLRLCPRYGYGDLLLGAQELLRPVGAKTRKLKQLRTRKRTAIVS
jgi:CelD/BcsL family acetyltransferase involved in cellulose biosynthesis